jgi:hypothetical protein
MKKNCGTFYGTLNNSMFSSLNIRFTRHLKKTVDVDISHMETQCQYTDVC